MHLTQRYNVKVNNTQAIILGCFGVAAAKLWNVANYEKRHYKELGMDVFPNWYYQKKALKDNFWYKNLPSQTAQDVLATLQESWKSFFELNKSKGVKNPQVPKFKGRDEKFNFVFLKDAIVRENEDTLRFSIPKQLKTYLLEKYKIKNKFLYVKFKELPESNIKQVEFKPITNNEFDVSIVYDYDNLPPKEDNGRYLSIDVGVTNLLTCYDNYNKKSFILSGKQLLSINRYFDKTIGKIQKAYYSQQSAKGIKYFKKSKRVSDLYNKRNKQVAHLLNCVTKYVVDYCIENNINTVVIGDITGIRENANLGTKNNQKFHKLPYAQIMNKLSYKLTKYGISFAKQKENYSSQCSPFAESVSKKYATPNKRVKRGLFIDNRIKMNADSVGAFNILRLYLKAKKIPLTLEPNGLSMVERIGFNSTCGINVSM